MVWRCVENHVARADALHAVDGKQQRGRLKAHYDIGLPAVVLVVDVVHDEILRMSRADAVHVQMEPLHAARPPPVSEYLHYIQS